MEGKVFDTYTFFDSNGDEWQIDFGHKGARIVYHGWEYFVPSFFRNKELLMELNGDFEVLQMFISKPDEVLFMEDLFDFLEAMHFNRGTDDDDIDFVLKNSPTKLVVL